MGRNIRWFSRIFTMALSLYRTEWMRFRRRLATSQNNNQAIACPRFKASHVLDALITQGASINSTLAPHHQKQNSSSQRINNHHPTHKRKRSNNDTATTSLGGILFQKENSSASASDPRIQALLDLSAPQVALVLAARRILSRDAQWNGGETASPPPPLTLGRMLQEYSNFVRTSAHNQRFDRRLLWVAFTELLEINLFRPASDHCGTGPFQYYYDHHQQASGMYSSMSEAEDIPMHLLVDINRELMEALQDNLLECSTAMREWGRKTNS